MRQASHELVCEQAKKIEADCDRASVRDSLVSANWYKWNLRLGVSSALLAGAAASAAQLPGNWKIVTSVLAVLAAILGSILTFLVPSERAATYHKFSKNYQALRDNLRLFIAFRCVSDDDTKALEIEFQNLLSEKRRMDADHPVVPEKFYAMAVDVIEQRKKRNKRMPDFQGDAPALGTTVRQAEVPAT
jgi:hypothetical protein